ncbi:MAG TPA: hypothetical protein VL994_00885 [Steroidobacteraceae bacterium]|nr:hypothetical protein [Steroidobacteraceae bacterium]
MFRAVAALVLASALGACQSAPPNFGAYEDQLAAAGFLMKPANTPQRQQMLSHLPPHVFLIRASGNATHYVYADPLVCDCLYVGTQQAYDRYRSNQLAQHLASEQQLAALTYDDAAWSWNAWGPWGLPDANFGFVYGPMAGW